MEVKERFLSNIDIPNECWEWQGQIITGYGRFKIGRRSYAAHRISYEFFIGPIPSGKELDHLCFNKACVNPNHLEPVTHEENVRRAIIHYDRPFFIDKTHCVYGHKLVLRGVTFRRKRCIECTSRWNRQRYLRVRSV